MCRPTVASTAWDILPIGKPTLSVRDSTGSYLSSKNTCIVLRSVDVLGFVNTNHVLHLHSIIFLLQRESSSIPVRVERNHSCWFLSLCVGCTIAIKVQHPLIPTTVLHWRKDRQQAPIPIKVTMPTRNIIRVDHVNPSFQRQLVKTRQHGSIPTRSPAPRAMRSRLSSDYDPYASYRADPYAAPANGQGALRHEPPVAYAHQQQVGYPPASSQRQQQPYGNAAATPYAPALPQYYGAQQRA